MQKSFRALSENFVSAHLRLRAPRKLMSTGLVLSFALLSGASPAAAHSIITPNQARAKIASHSEVPAHRTLAKPTPFSPQNCLVGKNVKKFLACPSTTKKAAFRVALTGDSHAFTYQKPVLALAKKYGWSVTFVGKSACPVVDASLYPANLNDSSCKWWNTRRESYFNAQRPFDLVINSNSSFITHYKTDIAESYALAVKKITDRNSKFLLIRDNPKAIDGVETCAMNEPKLFSGGCDSTREDALFVSDPLPAAVAGKKLVITADFTDAYCNDKICFADRFGKKVYRDRGHIDLDWAMHLLSRLDAVIPNQLKHRR